VGLPALDGESRRAGMAGEHLLGVAPTALMRVPPARRAEVHAEALRRLAEALALELLNAGSLQELGLED
jgi:hypothetical protein